MKLEKTPRGFEVVYIDAPCACMVVLQQSSVIGDYPDAASRPGSSVLRFGDHEFTRELAEEIGTRMVLWSRTGSLALPGEGK